jgi:hypothetical protein
MKPVVLSGQDDVRPERDQFRGCIARAPAIFDPHITTYDPTQFGQPLSKRPYADRYFWIVCS